MRTSTQIETASVLVGEEKAVEYVAKAGFDAWYFSMVAVCEGLRREDRHGKYVELG